MRVCLLICLTICGLLVAGTSSASGLPTLDLKILKLGETMAFDFGFAGVGFRVDPDNGWRLDGKPSYVDVRLGACKLAFISSRLPICPK